jgi:hypothetical protein
MKWRENRAYMREVLGKSLRDEDQAGPSHRGQLVRTRTPQFVIEIDSKTRMMQHDAGHSFV